MAGLILLHRADRLAELLPLGDVTGQGDEFGLCAGHLARAKAPVGWELIDRRCVPPVSPPPSTGPARPRVYGTPGTAANSSRPVWVPSRESNGDEIAELRTATSRLLRRAFRGDSSDPGEIEGQLQLPL